MFALIVCMLALTAHAAVDLLPPERFTDEFRAALSSALPGHVISTVEPLQLKIKNPQGQEATAFLNNAYDEYSLNPANRSQLIARYVESFAQSTRSSGPVDPQRIVPVIKDRGWVKEVRRAAKARGAAPVEQVIEEFNEDLVIVYAEDSPQNVRYFSADNLREAGVQKEKLRALAVENLRKILPPPHPVNGPLVSMMTAGGDYVPSLLLLDEIWSGGELGVEGEIIIAIPTRDVLLFTGSNNKDGVKKLRELARQTAADGPYSLTDRLFVYRGGKFERF